MLRIIRFNNRSVTEVQLQFSEELNTNLGVGNVRVRSNVENIPDLEVKSIRISSTVLSITTQPQRALALYFVELLDTDAQNFVSTLGNSIQNNNTFFFLGQERANEIRDEILDGLPNVYDTDQDTTVRKQISSVSEQLFKGRVDVRETGNANFLEVEVTDELKTRGFGPNDRLDNEGAYRVIRVSNLPEGATERKVIQFNAAKAVTLVGVNDTANVNTGVIGFPSDPYPLRGVEVVREIVSNAETLLNRIDSTTITVSNSNVAIVNSIVLVKADGTRTPYDLPRFGYAIKENRNDTLHGRKLVTLDTDEIRLSDTAILTGAFELPTAADELEVSYTHIDEGINVTPESVSVSQIQTVTREGVPALLTVFGLKNFPIVLSNDTIPTTGGVSFLDPAPATGTPFTQTHPAFRTELAFDVSRLPANGGEFSVDYSTGQVFVFGNTTNDGSGNTPPVADYLFRKIFIEGVDFNFDADDDEIVAVPSRDLIGEEVKVTFELERVFAPDVDFSNESHIEVIDEFVENRFSNTAQLATVNYPITNVFQVINETTGESYSVTRFNDNFIFYTGRQLPRFVTRENEQVSFALSTNETLFVTEELAATATTKTLKIELANDELVSFAGQKRGANANNELVFTAQTLFLREFFYDNVLQTVTTNLAKLSTIGDYLVDYKNGIVYLLTALDQDLDVGAITYKYAQIETVFNQILSVDEIGYRPTIKSDRVVEVQPESTTSTDITIEALPDSIERFFADDTAKPILFGTKQFGQAGQMFPGTSEFTASDGNFVSTFAGGDHILRIPGEPDRAITQVTSARTLLVDIPFSEEDRRTNWCIIDFNLDDGYVVTTTHDIDFIRAVYTVTELQTLDADSLTNLFDPELDTFSDKTITFNSTAIQSVPAGTALAIDYSFGTLYVTYTFVKDVLRVSYEHGDNSLNFGISDRLNAEDEYFVTYRFGALREKLLENFGSLTRIEDLTSFPLDFNRELYRDFLIGTLQAFVKGPTNESIKTLVESVTDIVPNIQELTFNEWTAGRDNLYLQEANTTGTLVFDSGVFEEGLIVDDEVTVSFPAEAYISHREGTSEAWAIANWAGIDNDADLTFDIEADVSEIFIGSTAFNPTVIPFTLNRADAEPLSPIGIPINFPLVAGHFIWFDDLTNRWNFESTTDGYGEITTSGQIYDVVDGYNLTSTATFIRFDGYGDDQDGYFNFDGYDGYASRNDFTWSSDDVHYLWDTGPSNIHNRLSVFKDGFGFLNFRIFDDAGRLRPNKPRVYNISHDVSDWAAGETHFIATSWRLNTAEGIDEMHLLVDGQEVSNVFKYGGRPVTTTTDLYRTVADEFLTTSAPKTIIGGQDGQSTASTSFTSLGSQFVTDGIIVGDTLTILDATADGAGSPHSIVGVGELSLVLSAPLTLTLNNIEFSVNQTSFTTQTNVDVETFAVFTDDGYDGYDIRVELRGLEATLPDYSVSRSGGVNTIFLNNGVEAGDSVIINTLGLTRGRCRDLIFNYEDGYQLKTRGVPPTAFEHFDVFKLICKRISIEDDGYKEGGDGYLAVDGYIGVDGYAADGYFTNLCQPSNTTTGKTLDVTLGGFNNIDFTGVNDVTVHGTTFSGAFSETLMFTSFSTITTTEFFTSITALELTFTAIDPSQSFGSIEVIESVPFTREENSGNFAKLNGYDNGVFSFIIFGSAGIPFDIEGGCFYLLDYAISLNIPMKRKGELFIGSSLDGAEQWDGVIDQVTFLNEMLDDIRVGEDKDVRTVTQDFNSPVPLTVTPQTLMLLNLNGDLDNVDRLFKTFDERFLTSSSSVNSSFGDSIIFMNDRSLQLDNANVTFNKNEGSIEFWVAPIIDTIFDESNTRYFIDITSIRIDKVVSDTAISLTLPVRAKRIVSVRLLGDDGTGTDFFVDGQLLVDGQTIILGDRLPGAMTSVEVQLVPVDFSGDRISIFRSSTGLLNFSIVADDQAFIIAFPITWRRDTWHRVMATWRTNSVDGLDRMRLFIDGVESGTLIWGSPGLLYGSGAIYGSAAVGTAGSNALVANIDLEDTFAEIHVGNSFDQRNSAAAKMDNLRFSNTIREPSIIAGSAVDLNFNNNREAVSPIVEDNFTTLLLDFDRSIEETVFLSNLLSKFTPLFQFDVEVDDSFRRLTDQRSRDLIESIIGRMKPAHSKLFVKFLQELQ